MDKAVAEILTVEETCCGTDTCNHTAISHDGHTGWIADGKLRCRTTESGPLFDCSLNIDEQLKCELVVLTDGHTHGPACGHELVPHGNHFDYLVGSRLHHVVGQKESCCDRACVGGTPQPASIVDHGYVHVRNRRRSLDSPRELEEQVSLIQAKTTTDFHVAGICCASEIPVIERILSKLPGVRSVVVSVVSKNVRVEHVPSKISPGALLSALNSAGLQASIGKIEKSSGTGIQKPPLYVLLAGLLLIVSLFGYVSSSVRWMQFFALAGFAVGSPLIFRRAVAALRQRFLDINFLTIIACGGAIALQEYYEAAAIVFLFGMAQWMENVSMGRARQATASVQELQPKTAILAESGTSVPVERITIGDNIIVRSGDRIPVDGIVVTGNSSVDESLLSGESRPVVKSAGDRLLSGSINSGGGSLMMRTTSCVTDSTIAQISKKLDEALQNHSNMQRAVEAFAKYYTPIVVFGAVFVALLPLMIDGLEWKTWLKTSLILLLTACPCALVISTPVTTVCGITRAAQLAVLIKGGNALETLCRLKAITFDKTGTLTLGHCTVEGVRVFGEMTDSEVLQCAASLELHSCHPLASSIVGFASSRGIGGTEVTSVREVPGCGLVGVRNGQTVSVGNWHLMQQQVNDLEGDRGCMETLEKSVATKGHKACFVAVDHKLVGALVVADRIRSEASAGLAALHNLGLYLGLLTGDGATGALHVARSVGIPIDAVHYELLPEDKVEILNDYQRRYGLVGHVGDGINDSLALAAADVGIAMGVGGSTMAVEAADVSLFSNDITSIHTAMRISHQVRAIIWQNIFFAVVLKTTVIILAFFHDVRLWHAVFADIGSSLVVIMNGLRLLGFERRLQNKGVKKSQCAGRAHELEMQKMLMAQDRSHNHCCGSASACCSVERTQRHGQFTPSVDTSACCSSSSTHVSTEAQASSSCCKHKHTPEKAREEGEADGLSSAAHNHNCCSHKHESDNTDDRLL